MKKIPPEFLEDYPTGRVSEHEIFLSFNGDDDAIDFRKWWEDYGEKEFFDWQERQ